jgi:hypothetical protein
MSMRFTSVRYAAYEIYACEMDTYELRDDVFLGEARDVGDHLTLKTPRIGRPSRRGVASAPRAVRQGADDG